MARSITSTDAVFTLTIPGLYDVPQVIQGYATDEMFDLDAIAKVETQFGIDGKLSQGYVRHPRKMKIKVAADSASQQVFDDWAAAMDLTLAAIPCQGFIVMLSNGTEYSLKNGALTSYRDMPDAKKVLQPQQYEITWESVVKSQNAA